MQLLLIFLVLMFLLMPAALLMVGIGLLIFVPAWLMATSLVTLVTAPQQILAIASDKRTRRAHSCEHATVNVLEEWYGPLPQVGGLATKEGFYLFNVHGFDSGVVLRAAQRGLRRMQCGERELAWHSRCGSSLLAARLVFAAAFLGLLVAAGQFTFGGVVLALALSWLFGRPLGLLVQKWFTTSDDVQGLEIGGLYWTDKVQLGNRSWLAPQGALFVRTVETW